MLIEMYFLEEIVTQIYKFIMVLYNAFKRLMMMIVLMVMMTMMMMMMMMMTMIVMIMVIVTRTNIRI